MHEWRPPLKSKSSRGSGSSWIVKNDLNIVELMVNYSQRVSLEQWRSFSFFLLNNSGHSLGFTHGVYFVAMQEIRFFLQLTIVVATDLN